MSDLSTGRGKAKKEITVPAFSFGFGCVLRRILFSLGHSAIQLGLSALHCR
jgi:hypothetical protein